MDLTRNDIRDLTQKADYIKRHIAENERLLNDVIEKLLYIEALIKKLQEKTNDDATKK